MSLTAIINNNTVSEINLFLKESLPDRGLFHSVYYKSAFDTKRNIIAPYIFTDSGYASVSGTAFDYFARFETAKYINDDLNKLDSLDIIAKYGTDILWYTGHKRVCRECIKLYDWSIEVLREYITDKRVHSEDKIIDICCFFARLEHLVRSGRVVVELLNKPADDILRNDLKHLIDGYRHKFIGEFVKPGSVVIFNPKFKCFHGADADICIDGVLYDFKTSKSIGYNWHEVAQIWMYFLLHEIDKNNIEIDAFSSMNIDRIALYRGRCADIDYVDIGHLNNIESSRDQLELLLKKYKIYTGFDYKK